MQKPSAPIKKRTRMGPRANLKTVDKRKILPVIEPRFICGPAFSLVTILTELHWLEFLNACFIEYELEGAGRTLLYVGLYFHTHNGRAHICLNARSYDTHV